MSRPGEAATGNICPIAGRDLSKVARLLGEGPILMESGQKKRSGCLWWWVGAALLLPVFLLFADLYGSSVLLGFQGGFRRKESFSYRSPDGSNSLIISQRFAFPANELFDPATVLFFEVRDASSGRLIDAAQLVLEEESDLREPDVAWKPGSVRITGMDERQARSVELKWTR